MTSAKSSQRASPAREDVVTREIFATPIHGVLVRKCQAGAIFQNKGGLVVNGTTNINVRGIQSKEQVLKCCALFGVEAVSEDTFNLDMHCILALLILGVQVQKLVGVYKFR